MSMFQIGQSVVAEAADPRTESVTNSPIQHPLNHWCSSEQEVVTLPIIEGRVLAEYRAMYRGDGVCHTPPILVIDDHECGPVECRLDVYEVEGL